MKRLIPVVIAVVAIAALTLVEGSISDRWVDTNRAAAYCATLLDSVPAKIGDWESVDSKVDDEIQKVAGAQGYVSRAYRNAKTGEQVGVWLIVGHARDTAEHTPDVCYLASGYQFSQEKSQYQIPLYDGEMLDCWTAMFKRQAGVYQEVGERVFWTWFKPDLKGETPEAGVVWQAPKNARFHFGSTKALYKLYFSETSGDPEAEPDDSICLDFARTFLAEVNPILAKANQGVPDDYTPPAEG